MAYSKNTWNNLDPATPLNAARMNKIEAGIETANAIIGNDGKVTDAGLPARLSDATLRAAFVAGRVLDSGGSPIATKRLSVKLTADGLDIDDLIIETVS